MTAPAEPVPQPPALPGGAADDTADRPPARAPAAPRRVVLERIAVRDFRNLARVELRPPPEGIAIIGENGHGKTNFLEAVYYLQLLRSMRGARDQDMVRFGEEAFHIAADVRTDRAHDLTVGFRRHGKKKRVLVDGREPQRLSDALGALPSVIFSPRDVQLVAGAPSERRRFLDVMLALTSRAYLAALQRYRAALAHRNAALRDAARSGAGDGRVSVWEPALAESGAVLIRARADWTAGAADEFARLCTAIGERGTGRLRYGASLPPAPGDTVEALREALAGALAAHRAHDIRRGLTHVGPHRDDLELTLSGADGAPRDLRLFGSAGQQRTAAIVLRMLESAALHARHEAAPLFLLDDPFAELDVRRSARILELLGASGLGQAILAVPRAADIPPELSSLERWQIRDGALAPERA